MFDSISPTANLVVALAYREAQRLGHDFVGTGHILFGLVVEREGVAGTVLKSFNITPEVVCSYVDRRYLSTPSLARSRAIQARRLLGMAVNLATHYVGTEHLLLAAISDPEFESYKIIEEDLGLNPADIKDAIMAFIGKNATDLEPVQLLVNESPVFCKTLAGDELRDEAVNEFLRDKKFVQALMNGHSMLIFYRKQ